MPGTPAWAQGPRALQGVQAEGGWGRGRGGLAGPEDGSTRGHEVLDERGLERKAQG